MSIKQEDIVVNINTKADSLQKKLEGIDKTLDDILRFLETPRGRLYSQRVRTSHNQ
jgi:hypothetical protein